jgi:acetyltransferase-like isoleucine patch superfamily enzyme
MTRYLLAFLLFAFPAAAQIGGNGGGINGNAYLPLTGGTITGALTAPTVNVTGAAGYQQNNLNAYRVIGQTNGNNAAGVLSGPFAGASIIAPTSTQFLTGFGAYVLESAQGSPFYQETTAMGMGAGIAMTTGGANTFLGIGAGSGITTETGVTAIGDTAMRNSSSFLGGSIAIGTGAYTDGAGGDEIVIGTNSLLGNSGTITMGGSITNGDVLTFPISTSNACNGTSITVNCTNLPGVSVSYTVTSGDTTLAILAGHIASALSAFNVTYTLGDGVNEASHNLYAFSWQIADATNHPTVIKGHFPVRWQITMGAMTCTGTCGETATITSPFSGAHNLLIGNNVLGYFGATTATQNVIAGSGSFGYYCTTCSFNSTFGYNIAVNATTASYNVASGNDALFNCISCSFNVVEGAYAGYQITGNSNTVLGDETFAGQGCITSGASNIEVGAGACVKTATASNQMSLQNIIYGAGNSGTGSTISTGQIGIANTAPNATFTVGDAAGNSTNGTHIGVLQTTAPTITNGTLDATGSDVAGTVTLSAANPVVTFKVAYATAPHCVISSPTGTAFTYTTSTTALTVTGGASTNKFSYICLQ